MWSNALSSRRGEMPTSLGGVSVKISGKPAYVYFVSPNQVNVLAGLDDSERDGECRSDEWVGDERPVSGNQGGGFAEFLLRRYQRVTSRVFTRTYSPLGPANLSVPGYTFTPARSGETILLYGGGFGPRLAR